jgi:hypothetical protein
MNRRAVYPLILTCAALIAITTLLSLKSIITQAQVALVLALVLGVLAVACLAYSAYVIISFEFGYKPEDQLSRRKRRHVHPLQTLLHLRIARHR